MNETYENSQNNKILVYHNKYITIQKYISTIYKHYHQILFRIESMWRSLSCHTTTKGIINAIKQFKGMWQARNRLSFIDLLCYFYVERWAKKYFSWRSQNKYFDVWLNWISLHFIFMMVLIVPSNFF